MGTTATVGRWGNASALRIPQPYCRQLGLEIGSPVSMSIENNALVIKRSDEEYTLRGRMRGWNGERYMTAEFDWGDPAGQEVW